MLKLTVEYIGHLLSFGSHYVVIDGHWLYPWKSSGPRFIPDGSRWLSGEEPESSLRYKEYEHLVDG
jgi:hypothetical protein